MRIKIENIIEQMSPEVRKAADEEARGRGLTLERFVESQLSVQLTDDDISLTAARIRFNSWDGRAEGPPYRGSVGVRGRFGRA
jgi:hypothetical protein